jgi:hypothetical protein
MDAMDVMDAMDAMDAMMWRVVLAAPAHKTRMKRSQNRARASGK